MRNHTPTTRKHRSLAATDQSIQDIRADTTSDKHHDESQPHDLNSDSLTPQEAARLIGVAAKTLANWRCQGFGPPFVKFGDPGGRGGVRYRRGDLLGWLREHTRQPSPGPRGGRRG